MVARGVAGDEVVAVLVARGQQRVDVEAAGVVQRPVGGGHRHDRGTEFGEAPGGRAADRAEALEGDPGAAQWQAQVLRRGVGGLGDAVAGDTELVVGDAAEMFGGADGGAAVAQLVLDDGGVALGQAHVESHHVLAGHLVGQRAGEGAQHRLLVAGGGIGDDAGLGAAVEEVDRRPISTS